MTTKPLQKDDPHAKALQSLVDAASAFFRFNKHISEGTIEAPADLTQSRPYLLLKDARNHARFVLQTGAADDTGAHAEKLSGACALQGMDLSKVHKAMASIAEVVA